MSAIVPAAVAQLWNPATKSSAAAQDLGFSSFFAYPHLYLIHFMTPNCYNPLQVLSSFTIQKKKFLSPA